MANSKDVEYARSRYTTMTFKQLHTRLGRMTKPEKLEAFATVVEEDLMEVVRRYGLGLMTYSPLAVGLLTGRFKKGEAPAGTPWTERGEDLDSFLTDHAQGVVDKLTEVAARIGKTPAQTALAWVLDHPEVTASIMGPDTPEQVDDMMGGLGWQLDPEDREMLDAISEIPRPRHIA